jgi:hypothetical protein
LKFTALLDYGMILFNIASQLIGNFAYTTLTSIPIPFDSSSTVGVFSFTGVYAILRLWIFSALLGVS